MLALVLTAQLSYGVKILADQSKDRPVSKVVNMLKSMQETLETEKAADEDMYEDLSCWCKENKQGKSTEVKDAEAAIGRLSSEVDELSASTQSLATEMEALAVEVKKATATLDQARIIHGNKMDELNSQESELNAEITAVSSAATAFSGSGATSLAQMPEGRLQKIAAAVQAAVEKRGSLLDNTLSFRDREKLDGFFKDPVKVAKETSLLQKRGDDEGELVGMFKAMESDFTKDLEEVTKQLAREKGSYEELMQSKKEEIEAGENSIESKRMQRVEKRQDMIEKKHEMEAKQKSIASAQEFLALVEEKCSVTDTEWVERQKTRQAEIDSVSEAINVLDGEDAHALFSKTYSFLQEDSMDQRLKKASSVIARAGMSHSDHRLIALVASAEIKGMEKVKAAIDEMKKALKKEQQDEVEKKDFCVGGFNDVAAKKAGVESEKSSHTGEVDKLEIKLTDISRDVSETNGKIEAAQKDLKTETADHKKELSDFDKTLADQKASQVVLKQALAKLKEFYETKPALVQQQATQTPEGVPAGFSDYKTSGNGLKVLQILQDVILETQAMEKETSRAKDVAVKDYGKLVAASEKDIGALQKELNNLGMIKARTKSDLLATKKSLKGDEKDLVDIATETANLHEDCDFLVKNFELRKSARTDELEGLAQAKAILSGSK